MSGSRQFLRISQQNDTLAANRHIRRHTFPDSVLNVGEEATFKVKVTNTGPLNMTNVTLRVKGQHGAKLKNPGVIIDPNIPPRASRAAAIVISQFVDELVSQPLPTISGHGGTATSEVFALKAPDVPQASQTLVKATLEGWDVDLVHPLVAHSDPLPDAPKATFSTAVVAS